MERTLAEYLALFPAEQVAVAREFLRLSPSVQAAGGASAPGERRVGPYRLGRELGRGGQAVVYLAEDLRLNRRVALKVLVGGTQTSERVFDRFQREATMASKLDHPGICTVFDTGVDGGSAYIAMRYVEGSTLATWIGQRKSSDSTTTDSFTFSVTEGEKDLTTRRGDASEQPSSSVGPSTRGEVMDVVRIIEQAARALHAAHEVGIIHRDIKPGNIMVTPDGSPVILDFGLARDDEDGHSLTQTGDLFGTPAYMSPEQLLAQRVPLDRRTDVWSLAVSLYEGLTLQRPFDGKARDAIYQAILTHPMPDPRKLNRGISADLKVVLETALEKDRNRRYRTALEFAEDLRRVRTYEPIKARPAGPLLRLRRFAQRNPVTATATIGGFLTLVIGLGTALVLLRETNKAFEETRVERDQKQAALAKERDAHRSAQSLRLGALSAAMLTRDPGTALLLAIEAAHIKSDPMANGAILNALDSIQELHGFTLAKPADSLVLSPDGQTALLCTTDGAVLLASTQSGTVLRQFALAETTATCADFDGDARRVAVGTKEGTVHLFDAQSGRRLNGWRTHELAVTRVRFDASGNTLASASADKTVALRDLQSRADPVRLVGHKKRVADVSFDPKSNRVFTVSSDFSHKTWNPETGTAEESKLIQTIGDVPAIERGPDGSRFVLLGLTTTPVFRSSTGRPEFTLKGHRGTVRAASFTADDKRIATGSVDGTVRIFDGTTGTQVSVLRGHKGAVHGVRFTSDGSKLVSIGEDSTLRVWSARTGSALIVGRAPISQTDSVPFTRDGMTLALTNLALTGLVSQVWDLRNGGSSVQAGLGTVLAISGDGRWLLQNRTQLFRPICFVHDVKTQASRCQLEIEASLTGRQAFTDDGALIAVETIQRAADGRTTTSIGIYDAVTGKKVRDVGGSDAEELAFTFSPDSRTLAITRDGMIELWPVDRVEEPRKIACGQGALLDVSFSNDGSRLAVIDSSHAVAIVNVASGSTVMRFDDFPTPPASCRFGRSPEHLLVVTSDSTILVWDLAQRRAMVTFRRGDDAVVGAALDDTDTHVHTVTKDGVIRSWPIDPLPLAQTVVPRALTPVERRLFDLELPAMPGSGDAR